MLTNQTIEILKSLDKTELKRFGDFIKSPYFNSSKPLEKIFDIVQKAYPELDAASLSNEKVFKKLYPSESFNEKRIKNLFSEFSTLLKKFLGFEEISADEEKLDIHIAQALSQKNLEKISSKVIEKSIKDNDDGLLSISDKFHYLYEMNFKQLYNIEQLHGHGSPEYLKFSTRLMEQLTIFSFMNIFQHSFYDIMNQNVLKTEENIILREVRNAIDADKIISYFSNNNHEYASYLKIHYLFYYYSINEISEKQYADFKKEIFKTIRKVRKNDQSQFIMRMIHLILTNLVSKNRKYYEDIIEFAELFKTLKIYPDKNFQVFNTGTFQDIFITAMSLGKFEWGENFVNEYVNYLGKEHQEYTKNYSKGILSFNHGKFEESLNYLGKVKAAAISDKINIRFYYIMNFIELKYYESAISAIASFRQFIADSDEIPEMFSEGINETLKFFTEVTRKLEKGEKSDDYIINEAKKKVVFYKKYILEKLTGTKVDYNSAILTGSKEEE